MIAGILVLTVSTLPQSHGGGLMREAVHVAPPMHADAQPTPVHGGAEHVQLTELADPYAPATKFTIPGSGVPAEHSGVAGPVAVYG